MFTKMSVLPTISLFQIFPLCSFPTISETVSNFASSALVSQTGFSWIKLDLFTFPRNQIWYWLYKIMGNDETSPQEAISWLLRRGNWHILRRRIMQPNRILQPRRGIVQSYPPHFFISRWVTYKWNKSHGLFYFHCEPRGIIKGPFTR